MLNSDKTHLALVAQFTWYRWAINRLKLREPCAKLPCFICALFTVNISTFPTLAGNNPMVGMTVSVAVAVEESLKK